MLKVRKAGGQVLICNMDEFVRFGADIIRLGDYAPIVADRQAALDRLAAEESLVRGPVRLVAVRQRPPVADVRPALAALASACRSLSSRRAASTSRSPEPSAQRALITS